MPDNSQNGRAMDDVATVNRLPDEPRTDAGTTPRPVHDPGELARRALIVRQNERRLEAEDVVEELERLSGRDPEAAARVVGQSGVDVSSVPGSVRDATRRTVGTAPQGRMSSREAALASRLAALDDRLVSGATQAREADESFEDRMVDRLASRR